MNFVTILLILGAVYLYLLISGWRAKTKQMDSEHELLHEQRKSREHAQMVADKMAERKKIQAKFTTDVEVWRKAYHNKELNTLRVTASQLDTLMGDPEFLANKSGKFLMIEGLYRNNKVMMKDKKLRRKAVNANSNKKA